MYNTFDEIKSSKFINNLEETAKRFGLHGVYVKWNDNNGLDDNSIYFVVGSDKEKVFSKKLDIDEYFDSRSKESQFLHLDIGVIKLTDCSPFATHQAVTQYCRDVEFVKDIFTAYNRPIPKKIDYTSLMYLKTLYKNAIDKSLKPENAAIYRRSVEEYIWKIEEKLEDINTPEESEEKGFNRLLKKRDNDNKNQVSLEKLFKTSSEIITHVISEDLFYKFKEKIKEYPEIQYYASDVNKVVFDAPEKGFGDKKSDNDLSTVKLAYDASVREDITLILSKIAFPEAFKVSVQEMREIDDKLCCLGIQEEEYKQFASLCERNKIHFSMNDEDLFYGDDANLMNIVFYKKDIPKIDKILTALARNSELYHIFSEDTSIKIGYNSISIEEDPLKKALAAQGIDIVGNFDDR